MKLHCLKGIISLLSLFILNLSFAQLTVDDQGLIDEPITDKAVFFAELIPSEDDGTNRVDQMLVFSEGEVKDWSDYSTAVRFSGNSRYVDVRNGDHFAYDEETKIGFELGERFQCWISVDVPANTYSLYVRTQYSDELITIFENARFRKHPVTALTRWSTIHNRGYEDDALQMNALGRVANIGAYPEDYVPSEGKVPFSIVDDQVPVNAHVVDVPDHGFKMGRMDLRKVVVTDSTTELYFHTTYRPGWWISIPEQTFIRPVGTEEKLLIIGAEGIAIGTHHFTAAKGYTDYKLIFPAVDSSVSRLDYGEANDGGNWFIYDIELQKEKPDLPQQLAGNWFDKRTGDWQLSLFDDVAIYRNKVWQYDEPLSDDQKGTINLVSNDQHLKLPYQVQDGGMLQVSKSKDGLLTLGREINYQNASQPSNPPPFQAPVLEMDTAVISGYVYGYSPRVGISTGMLHLDNVLTGSQESYLIEIQDDGYFSAQVPLNYPKIPFIRMKIGNIGVLLTPGEETFVLINTAQRTHLVMGANARISSEVMNEEFDIISIDQNEVRSKILDMSANDYKTYCLQLRDKDLETLESLKSEEKISDRYYQLLKREIPIRYARDILHYKFTYEGEYRRQNNIPRNQRELPIEVDRPDDPPYYDFITNDMVNDPLAVICPTYENFINALKYLQLVQNKAYANRAMFMDIADELQTMGVVFSPSEQVLLDGYKAMVTPEYLELNDQYLVTYGAYERNFYNRHRAILSRVREENPDRYAERVHTFEAILSYKDTITLEDRDFLIQAFKYYGAKPVREFEAYQNQHKEQLMELVKKYDEEVFAVSTSIDAKRRAEILETDLKIEQGQGSDFMQTQDILRRVESQMSPLGDVTIDYVCEITQGPFVADYIKSTNRHIAEKVTASKKKNDYVANEVPASEADKLFSSIIDKYEGKVVYVDFWATWCGPCIQSMRRLKPLKKEMKDKDMVFVYITNQTSPEKTYNNMIPGIGGEHYRVSSDQWNYMSEKFNITGIPHYAIVNKKGEVVDPDASRDPDVLKKKFAKLMAE